MNPWDWLQDGLEWMLNFLNQDMNLTYGWAIVILTVLVRVALLPLVIKQYSSMRAMQAISPELKELQAKHKGDRQKLNQEMMTLYQERGVNPFASCLPLVAQLPVFFALYWVLRRFSRGASAEVGDLSFLWVVSDITVDLKDLGAGAIVMAVIYAVSQLISTELTMNASTPPSQRRIFRIMPIGIVATFFVYPFPAGLLVYWVASNLWTAGQQLVMRHRLGLAPTPAIAGATNATGGKGSRTPSQAEAAGIVAEPSEIQGDGDGDAAATETAVQDTPEAKPQQSSDSSSQKNGKKNGGKKHSTPRGRKRKGGGRRRPARKRR